MQLIESIRFIFWLKMADRYVGMMKEGHHEGQGTMYYHNGDTYTGDATCVTCDV